MEIDGLSAALITDGLETRVIGQRVIYYPNIASTMDVARKEAQRGAAEGTVVIVEEQSAGRGRRKRAWLSPKGSVALSLILYPGMSRLPYLNMLASVAVARSIESVTGLKTQLKWPNDVLINGKKVSGILIENELHAGQVAWAIIGIGINVNLAMADYPEISAIATSLSDELRKEVPRVAIVRQLLLEMDDLYLALGDGGSVYREWHDRLATLGKRVRVTSGEEMLEGVAETAARDGSLVLRCDNGDITQVVAGDVTLREDS